MKEYITENIEEGETEFIDTEQVADKIFDGKPGMKSEFIDKIEKANVPQKDVYKRQLQFRTALQGR